MEKIQIGALIKTIAQEKNLKVSQLAELTGRTRQSIYMTFGRSDMTNDEISEWAKVLGVELNYLLSRWKANDISHPGSVDLLSDQIARIEALFSQQLAIKDKQIEGLQRTVDVLLGKSECVTDETGKVIEFVTYEVGQIA